MIKELQTIFAGFGGQGILFAGKVMAYCGLLEGRQLSWLPSYGPEMRGGTANCSVCLSEEAIGSPLVVHPDALVVMNRQSLEKFENRLKITSPASVISHQKKPTVIQHLSSSKIRLLSSVPFKAI